MRIADVSRFMDMSPIWPNQFLKNRNSSPAAPMTQPPEIPGALDQRNQRQTRESRWASSFPCLKSRVLKKNEHTQRQQYNGTRHDSHLLSRFHAFSSFRLNCRMTGGRSALLLPFEKYVQHVDGDREDRRRVVLRPDLHQGLQVPELEGHRLLLHDGTLPRRASGLPGTRPLRR